MKTLGFDNISRIYSAVDSEKYITERDYENDLLNIAMVGEIDLRHKDFLTFVKMAEIINESLSGDQKIRFHIAGAGRDEDIVKAELTGKNLDDVFKMHGFVEDMGKFYESMDILVHTVFFEGLGTAVLQGMASGLPVIASDAGGLPELIEDGVSGLLVPVNDPAETASKALSLIDGSELRRRLGKAAESKVKKVFSVDAMAAAYVKLYEELIYDRRKN